MMGMGGYNRGDERQRELRRLAADAKSGKLRHNWEADQMVGPGFFARLWAAIKGRFVGKGNDD